MPMKNYKHKSDIFIEENHIILARGKNLYILNNGKMEIHLRKIRKMNRRNIKNCKIILYDIIRSYN